MKLSIFLVGILVSFSALSDNEEWRIRTSDTICSMQTYDSVKINDNELASFALSFGVASQSHELSEHLRAIGLKPNKFILQIDVSIHRNSDELGLLGDEIKMPVQVQVNDVLLDSYKGEYGVTHYLHDKKVESVLEQLSHTEPFQFYIHLGSAEKPMPITVTKKRFGLHYQLLKSCAEYFE